MKQINDKVEKHIDKAYSKLNKLFEKTLEAGYISVRETRQELLSIRSSISTALKEAGKIERVRYQKHDKER